MRNKCLHPDMNDCHRLATCTPDGDSYTCKCNKGFFGNGTHCYDPCNATNCPDNSMCINLDMSNTTCRCDKDYFLHNGTCKKIDFAYEVRALTCIDITFVILKAFRFEWCYFLIKTFDFQFWLKDDLLFLTASSQKIVRLFFNESMSLDSPDCWFSFYFSCSSMINHLDRLHSPSEAWISQENLLISCRDASMKTNAW